MEVKKHAQAFWENGFIVLEDFFDPNMMDTLNAIILVVHVVSFRQLSRRIFVLRQRIFKENSELFDEKIR